MTRQTLAFAPRSPAALSAPRTPPRPLSPGPDLAFAALPLLNRAVEALASAAPAPTRWRAPAAHFFHGPKPHAQVCPSDLVDDVVCLMGAVEVRHAARAVPGLPAAARAAAPHSRAARRLLTALELLDDEVIQIRVPATGATIRVLVRGVPDFARLGELLRERLGMACQFVHPRALLRDGGLAPGVAAAGDWFWGGQPLARLPRAGGERRVLVVPARVTAVPGDAGLPHVVAELEFLSESNIELRRAG